MFTFRVRRESYFVSCKYCAIFIFTVALVKVSGYPSGVHVDGYREHEEPVVFQQYIQVRKTHTVEHLPASAGYQQSPNLHTSASNSNSDVASSTHTDEDGDQYHIPRLREEVSNYKKQEVYEEKGYGDSAYDHENYGGQSYHPSSNDHGNSLESLPSENYRKRSNTNLHSPDGTSTKILEYAASNMYDKDAHDKGIYAARDNIYCPEVIDFDLSSKAMGMGKSGNRGAKPRLKGLGGKITCLKNKYFGREPLPKAIFAEPSEAKESVIEMPSFENFFQMVRKNVDSMSSFQHV